MKKDEFRIAEHEGKFWIERKFIEKNTTGWLWWRKTKFEEEWKCITWYGSACQIIDIGPLTIDTYKYKMEDFNSIEAAEIALDKLINPEPTKYHYLP